MTFKWYRLFHKAWTEHPPVDWLMAAQLGYKSPDSTFKTALENTRRMYDMITGSEAVARQNAEYKSR